VQGRPLCFFFSRLLLPLRFEGCLLERFSCTNSSLVCSSDLALPATRRGRIELMPSMASRHSQRPSGPDDDDKRRSFKDGWGQAPGGGGASSSAPPIVEKRKREQLEDDSASKK
jgi:hypothetical protein